jgi:putative glutamine amidotransferase
MKPLIGITPSPTTDVLPHGTFERYVIASTYVDAVTLAGGIPVVVPPQADIASLLDAIDGLLLSGGADVDPARYGDHSVHPTTYGVSDLRDRFELALVNHALEHDLPLLAICRGIQVLNVALGGTLIQDIADQHSPQIQHRQHDAAIDKDEIGHSVTLAADSHLAAFYGAEEVGVNSFHHQAIREAARELVPIGFAEDGVIEAVTLPTHSFVLGVQWHPEIMVHRHPIQLQPFRALVDAALSRKLAVVPA